MVAIASVAVSSCTSDPAVVPTDSENSFTFVGKPYGTSTFRSLTTPIARKAVYRSETQKGELTIFGLTTVSSENFSLFLTTEDAGIGSYSIGNQAAGFPSDIILKIQSIAGVDQGTYLAISGNINVIQWDTVGGYAKGSFQARLVESTSKDTIEIRDGVFNLPRLAPE